MDPWLTHWVFVMGAEEPWYVGIYNDENAACEFSLRPDFDPNVVNINSSDWLHGTVSVMLFLPVAARVCPNKKHLHSTLQASGYQFFSYLASKALVFRAYLKVSYPPAYFLSSWVVLTSSQGTGQTVLNLYGRSLQYPTPYETDSAAIWTSQNNDTVEVTVKASNGQYAYFAVYNPSTSMASFQLSVEATEGALEHTRKLHSPHACSWLLWLMATR